MELSIEMERKKQFVKMTKSEKKRENSKVSFFSVRKKRKKYERLKTMKGVMKPYF